MRSHYRLSWILILGGLITLYSLHGPFLNIVSAWIDIAISLPIMIVGALLYPREKIK